VQELDWILDRHDVCAPCLVDVIDHRRQRRALPAARRARDEHEAAFLFGDFLQDRG
jgi:hypothetical protein